MFRVTKGTDFNASLHSALEGLGAAAVLRNAATNEIAVGGLNTAKEIIERDPNWKIIETVPLSMEIIADSIDCLTFAVGAVDVERDNLQMIGGLI